MIYFLTVLREHSITPRKLAFDLSFSSFDAYMLQNSPRGHRRIEEVKTPLSVVKIHKELIDSFK